MFHIKYLQESLKKAFLVNDVKILKADYDSFKNNNDSDKKPALDQSFRELLLHEVITDVEKVDKLVTLSIEAARLEMVSVTIPVVLLGDAFDAVTLDKCEKLFSFVEDKVSVWKEECFFTACKNNLLRICNDLLRRLSRSQNTVFCGKILLFLAKFFPFSERSGLNIVSEFNLDNITEYGVEGKDIGDVLGDTVEDIPVQIDYNLYCKFWALQDYFRNPNQCYNKVQWKSFAYVSLFFLFYTQSSNFGNISSMLLAYYQHLAVLSWKNQDQQILIKESLVILWKLKNK